MWWLGSTGQIFDQFKLRFLPQGFSLFNSKTGPPIVKTIFFPLEGRNLNFIRLFVMPNYFFVRRTIYLFCGFFVYIFFHVIKIKLLFLSLQRYQKSCFLSKLHRPLLLLKHPPPPMGGAAPRLMHTFFIINFSWCSVS